MLHNSPIAGKLFLGNFNNLLEVVLRGEALHRGQRLPAVPLLDPDMNQSLISWPGIIVSGGVVEWVIGLQVLKAGHILLKEKQVEHHRNTITITNK